MSKLSHVRTSYDESFDKGTENHQPSLTQQHFEKECNINNIVARAKVTGVLIDPTVKRSAIPKFGDFTQVSDFQSANNLLIQAREAFSALPAEIRKKFDNQPQKLMAFLEDPQNNEEAVKLGLREVRIPSDSEKFLTSLQSIEDGLNKNLSEKHKAENKPGTITT